MSAALWALAYYALGVAAMYLDVRRTLRQIDAKFPETPPSTMSADWWGVVFCGAATWPVLLLVLRWQEYKRLRRDAALENSKPARVGEGQP